MYDTTQHDFDSIGKTLASLATHWKGYAAVNCQRLNYDELMFDPAKKDFSESLLPFRRHDAWREAPDHIKRQCLSYAWVIYNLKTVHIECDIVSPACEDFIKHPSVTSKNQFVLQDVMSQALLDEALHTRMSIGACNYIYSKRNLPVLQFRDFNLVAWRDAALGSCTAEWQRRLTRFGIACASETLITDYLKTMAKDDSIQETCHLVTKTHAADEWCHSGIFSSAAIDVIYSLSASERAYLKAIISKTVEMFADNEISAWERVFQAIKFPGYQDILADNIKLSEVRIYRDSVNALERRIGLEG